MSTTRTRLSATLLLAVLLTTACDRYTGPSPIDGVWHCVEVRATEGAKPLPPRPLEEEGALYLNISNVLYTWSYSHRGEATNRRYSWGNVYFRRDSMILINATENGPKAWPIPGGQPTDTLRLKYQVWHKELTLWGEGFRMRLQAVR